MKILIIEDDPMYRDIFVKVCQRHAGGHEIRTAGSLAISDVVRETFMPDIVFSDHSLPDGKGPSRFMAMRIQNPDLVICLMTGENESLGHGADYFFQKGTATVERIHQILSESVQAMEGKK